MNPTPTVAGLRRQDWGTFVVVFAAVSVVIALVRGNGTWALVSAVLLAVALVLTRRWSRLYPAPMPHALRFLLHLSHPGLTPAVLQSVLAPRAGERLLEIGPGIDHHALPMAEILGPTGQLEVLDVQPAMLDDLRRRAAERGIGNIVANAGDAQQLPYPDASLDGAYLITVLGEIPSSEAALRELRRVVRPGGRIVVGELVIDPDYVPPSRLRELARAAGLTFAEQRGTWLAYMGRLMVPGPR